MPELICYLCKSTAPTKFICSSWFICTNCQKALEIGRAALNEERLIVKKIPSMAELWDSVVCPLQPTRPQDHRYGKIPYRIAEEAYKEYEILFGNSQDLATLNRRGGFGDLELIYLLYRRARRNTCTPANR